ncbi:IpaC/SipC family type III secretion system needle tip complex protein [Chromobacterium violaceum]|uniref:IpaC/SipC family type III secretion system needle tip complex protein n=1 Tax=Chromobacterium violaceum TaxID=536 RepID=UPI001B3284CA|nr:IpaC/SipC family type III secretion system needle tip complex protein [Chromobacterium violaceum]MBP4049432.1 IpaC/SipC family type III secretion system needle tip complex protein [Chromobacterium violaceum]
MTAITSSPLFPSRPPLGGADLADGAAKPRAQDGLISVGTLQAILSQSGSVGRELAGALAGKPDLVQPKTLLKPEDAGVLHGWLSAKREDAGFVAGVEHTANKLEQIIDKELEQRGAEQDAGFDISGLSTRMAALLSQAIVLMSALRTADNALSTKLSLVSFDATKATAASMVREGIANLSSSIVQSVGQVAITGVGAKKSLNGLNAERGALKNNTPKLEKMVDEKRNIQTTLDRQNTVKLGTDADGLKQVGLKPQNGAARPEVAELSAQPNAAASVADGMAGDKIGLQSSNPRLSKEHESALVSAAEELDVKIRTEERVIADINLKAETKKTTGKAIMDSSSAVGNISGGSGRYAATLEQSEQQISQASSRVASTASEETRESSRKADSIIQDLLRTLEGNGQSMSSTMAAIAGNIRV